MGRGAGSGGRGGGDRDGEYVKTTHSLHQLLKSEKAEFWSMLEYTDSDIILASEAWLYPGITEREILPDNYRFVARKDRKRDPHGGVAIIAKAEFDAVEIELSTKTEFVAESFVCKNLKQPLIFGSVYRPTDNIFKYTEDLCNALSYIGCTYKNSTIWIGGDSNLPDIDWKINSIVCHNYLIPINKSILDMIQNLGAEQMVGFPTHKDNILDIFVTNRSSLVNKCKPIPGLSDHDMDLIDANIVPTRQKPTRRLIYLWKKASLTEMEQDIAGFSRSFTSDFSETTPINTLWATFKKKCMEVLQKHVPSKYTSARYSQSWC